MSLSVRIAVFRIPAFILLSSQKSVNWNFQLKCFLGFWAFICMTPWTPPRDTSITICLGSVRLNTWGWFNILQELNIVFQTSLISPFLPSLRMKFIKKEREINNVSIHNSGCFTASMKFFELIYTPTNKRYRKGLFKKCTLMLLALIIRWWVVSVDKTIQYCEVILGPIASIKSTFLFSYFTEIIELKPDS